MVKRVLKQAIFLSVNLLFGRIILQTLAMFRSAGFGLFDYLFFIYPGSGRNIADIEEYCPSPLSHFFAEKIVLCGVIRNGCGSRGLVVGTFSTMLDFVRDKALAKEMFEKLESLRSKIGAKKVAFAGQLAGFLRRRGISFNGHMVDGVKGTVFSIVETINKVMTKHKMEVGNFRIAVIGIGYVGAALIDCLETLGHRVLGIDIRATRRGVVPAENSPAVLRAADMVVVLTPSGDDITPYLRHLRKGTIVIDDTHPMIRGSLADLFLYKVAMGIKDTEFLPRLAGYNREWIPGCVVEAIVSASEERDHCEASQEEFNVLAKRLGFQAKVIETAGGA